MAGVKPPLGKITRRPDDFQPTEKLTDDRYYYQIDRIAEVVKRTPLVWSDNGSSAYFELAEVGASRPSLGRTAEETGSDSSHLAVQTFGRRTRRAITSLAVMAMVSAILLVIYPYYPAVQYQVGSQLGWVGHNTVAASDQISAINKLYVPKIGVTANILEGPNLSILNKQEGVWHQTGLADGNLVIAGHRWKYLPPNSTTFYNLNKLQPGDRITVDWEGKRYYYAVTSDKVVPETDLLVLNQTDHPQLTLYTCNDFHQTQRIVVMADLLP